MDWLKDLLDHIDTMLINQGIDPADACWSTRRRMAIMHRWSDSAVRAAEQDARLGKPDDLARYDAEVAAIKLSIVKPESGE